MTDICYGIHLYDRIVLAFSEIAFALIPSFICYLYFQLIFLYRAPKASSGSGKGKGKGGSKGTNMDDREHNGGGADYTREDHHRSPPHENDHDSDDYPWNHKKDGECGLQGNGASCPHDKPCCGKNGRCALSGPACGHGCQSNFGACLASRSPPTKGNSGSANSLQAGDANSQATTISPITAAIVGASAFVAGILFAILLFVAAKKRGGKATERKERKKNVVAVAVEEEDDGSDNNDVACDHSMGQISSLHSTPTFGALGNNFGYPDGGNEEVLSPNPTMVDVEENNNNQLSLDEGEWQTAMQKTSGRSDAFGHDANLAALEQQLYNAESRKWQKNHMSSIREEMCSENVPIDETLYETPPPPPPMDPLVSKRDRYFDFHDDDDFLGTY